VSLISFQEAFYAKLFASLFATTSHQHRIECFQVIIYETTCKKKAFDAGRQTKVNKFNQKGF
jgi:hypothetical protein